ncbi:MAG TPA: pentapeptide repeat-containing protein [Devosiaceae bacterium]
MRRQKLGEPIEEEDLSEIDWADLPEVKIVVRQCDIRGGRLNDAVLPYALFERCDFTGCRFASADLSHAQFQQCNFFDANLRAGCDFSRAQLLGAQFDYCNLSMSRFIGTDMYGATLNRCKAPGVDFEDAVFVRKVGRQLIGRGALTECQLDMALFRDLELQDCNFESSSLRQADFSRANLSGANLRRADLTEANLRGSVLDKTDLRDATLNGFDLPGLKSYAGLKVSESGLGAVVASLGMRVFPG